MSDSYRMDYSRCRCIRLKVGGSPPTYCPLTKDHFCAGFYVVPDPMKLADELDQQAAELTSKADDLRRGEELIV